MTETLDPPSCEGRQPRGARGRLRHGGHRVGGAGLRDVSGTEPFETFEPRPTKVLSLGHYLLDSSPYYTLKQLLLDGAGW